MIDLQNTTTQVTFQSTNLLQQIYRHRTQSSHAMVQSSKWKYWRRLSGPKLLQLIIGVSAMAIAYEGMSQGVMGAVNVSPEYSVSSYLTLVHVDS
jgi:type II secretory pathway component PulL